MIIRKHYFKDATALGYLEPSKKTHAATVRAAMDVAIAKGELLKANIAKMREAHKRKY